MGKKILIIGNSAKAYALAKKLSNNHDIYITPASDTLKEFTTCLDLRDSKDLLEFAVENSIDLTIPVTLYDNNTVDIFIKNNQPIFAPSRAASSIVLDKALAKKILYKLRIPTPKFGIFEKSNLIADYIKNLKNPFVIKTNQKSSAVVFTSSKSAKNITDSMLAENAGKIIIEDYIWGSPFNFYTITDGYKALPIGSSIMYKHSLEGDGGQLTSGMGAISPNYKLSVDHEYYLMDNVIYPTLDYLEIEGNPYTGILGINGIITDNGDIFVLGYESFLQDCDAAAILNLVNTDLYSLFKSCVIGSFSDEVEFIEQKDLTASSLVLVCKNKDNFENVISGIDMIDDNTELDFFSSVIKNKYLEYEAVNGSVLVLTATGRTVTSSVNKMYSEAEEISFNGLYYRNDIGMPLIERV